MPLWYLLDKTHKKTQHSSIPQPASQQVCVFFQTDFSTQFDLVFPPSVSNILSFIEGHQLAAYVFFFVFPSLRFLPLSFNKAVPTHHYKNII